MMHFLDVTVAEINVESQFLEILKTVRPQWTAEHVKFKTFTEGITNKLLGAYLDTDTSREDMVLMRIYGEGSDLMINRDIEMQNMIMLHSAGCAKQLYAKFNNGILYGFVQGECLDEVSVRDPVVTKLFAEEIVRMMAIKPDELDLPEEAKKISISKEPCLFTKSWQFFELVPDTYPDPERDARCKKLVAPKETLKRELEEMEKVLTALDCPVVFCHNDLLLKNIVYNKKTAHVSFIDYEYGGFNYLPFDLGNHFCEYAGLDEVDYDRYPDEEYQRRWLRQFLEVKAKHEGSDPSAITEEQVTELYRQTNKFALMAHFFWGLWALIQARYSTIDFDYIEYASIRLNEYFRRKDSFLAL